MSAATEQYLRYMRLSAAESSVTARRRALARMERAIGPLLEVTAAELLAWREGLRQGPGTIANYVAHARGFWAWAAAEGLAAADLAAGLPVPPVPQLLPRPASDADVLAAVAGAPQPVRVMLVLAGWCGLRAQEIARLRRSAVLDKADPPAILVTVRAAKGWRERIVPMPPFVLAELTLFGLPPSGWVIGRMDGKPGPNQPHRVSQLCNRYLHEIGIADTLHQWRHWFATGMYHQTKDLRMVQGLLGHASPATTAGYAKYDQAAAAAAAAALPVPGLRVVILWAALRLAIAARNLRGIHRRRPDGMSIDLVGALERRHRRGDRGRGPPVSEGPRRFVAEPGGGLRVQAVRSVHCLALPCSRAPLRRRRYHRLVVHEACDPGNG